MDDCNLDYIKQNWEREREREREGGTEVPGSLDSCFTPNIMEVTGWQGCFWSGSVGGERNWL